MTCKDCKQAASCKNKNKSYKYEGGDSWANWCDEFAAIHQDKTVIKNGLRVTQCGYNFNVWVFDDESGKLVMHAMVIKELTIEQLEKYADLVNTQIPKLLENIESKSKGDE